MNSKIVDVCLKDAIAKKQDCTVAFLDISKAFDRIGHRHIKNSLMERGISANMTKLICNLLIDNRTRISANRAKTEDIYIKCGVPQGWPLSPILFNIAIDYIFKEICEPGFTNTHGYHLDLSLDAVCLSGFADD